MNKSYLVGYYGMKNTGDDALLAATAWGARNYLGSEAFIVNTPIELRVPKIGKVDSTIVAEQRFMAQNRLRQYACSLKSNGVIFGGGSVLQNKRDIDLKRDLLTLTRSKNNFALGVGIGPFETVSAEKSCAKFLSSCSFVGVRDEISKDIALSIAPFANVETTFDLAPTLLSMERLSLNNQPRRGIAVSLCPHEEFKGQPLKQMKRHKEIAEALKRVYLISGEPFILVDFNGHHQLGDKRIHDEIEVMMGDVPVERIDYDANPLRVLQRMATFKAIVSMRLHGSILAFLANTPVVSINYHQKCYGWCEQIGMPGEYIFSTEEVTRDDLSSVITRAMDIGFLPCSLSVTDANKASLKNWSIAHDCLSSQHFGYHSAV